MATREMRAARRRAQWTGEVVDAGQAKGLGYARLSFADRLRAFTELNRRAWLAVGRIPSRTPRGEWPGEVFEIRRRG